MDDKIKLTADICQKTQISQDDNCQNVTLTISKSELTALVYSENKQDLNIDYALAAQYWGVAFTSVFTLWLFSKCIGLIINMVRRA